MAMAAKNVLLIFILVPLYVYLGVRPVEAPRVSTLPNGSGVVRRAA